MMADATLGEVFIAQHFLHTDWSPQESFSVSFKFPHQPTK